MTKALTALAKKFGLEDYRDFKIELNDIYIIQEDEFGRDFWLFFAKKNVYKNNYVEMFTDIKNAIN